MRSLAHDLGEALGCGAHLSALRRTRSGEFGLERAVPLRTLLQSRRRARWPRRLVPLDGLLPDLPAVTLRGGRRLERLKNGVEMRAQATVAARRSAACRRLVRLLGAGRRSGGPGQTGETARNRHGRVVFCSPGRRFWGNILRLSGDANRRDIRRRGAAASAALWAVRGGITWH